MKYGKPQPNKNIYYKAIEAEINRIFMEVFYKPLLLAIRKTAKELKNESNPVTDAIASGQIWYEDAQFFGTFNAAISRAMKEAGAHWNKKAETWGISATDLPIQWRMALASARLNFTAMQQQIFKVIDNFDTEQIDRISLIPDVYIGTINRINADFEPTIQAAYSGVQPQLTEAQRNTIAADWGQNLDLYIKKFSNENIIDLRQKIEKSALSGQRSSALIETIQQNYGVSQNKARFLARQETSLMLSKFHETRYKDMGSTRYKWSTSHDERVREDHKELDGKICSWDQPPVVDKSNGRRGHPGTDFGCRCVAIPIFD